MKNHTFLLWVTFWALMVTMAVYMLGQYFPDSPCAHPFALLAPAAVALFFCVLNLIFNAAPRYPYEEDEHRSGN